MSSSGGSTKAGIEDLIKKILGGVSPRSGQVSLGIKIQDRSTVSLFITMVRTFGRRGSPLAEDISSLVLAATGSSPIAFGELWFSLNDGCLRWIQRTETFKFLEGEGEWEEIENRAN